MKRFLIPLLLAPLSGCALLEEFGEIPQPPSAEMIGVNLVQAPTLNQLASYGCYTYIGDTFVCGSVLGLSKVARPRLQFGFDLGIDLSNPNRSFGIPLTNILFGLSVFEDNQLGSICVSFCDEGDPSCADAPNDLGACSLDGVRPLNTPSDLVPTVDDLLSVAVDALDGELENPFAIQTIPRADKNECVSAETVCETVQIDGVDNRCCDDVCVPLGEDCRRMRDLSGQQCVECDGRKEAHVRLDIGIDPMLQLIEELVIGLADDLLSGGRLKIKIPIQAEGAVFVDVPTLGRYAIGVGPLEDQWVIQ